MMSAEKSRVPNDFKDHLERQQDKVEWLVPVEVSILWTYHG